MLWTARITYSAAGLSSDDARSIEEALKSIAWVEHHAGRGQLHITMDADTETLAEATDTVLAAATEATGLLKPIRLSIMPAADFADDTAEKIVALGVDLLRIADIAALLDVSRQRADQLATTDPDFPAPVALTAGGRLYSCPSIEAYVARRAAALAQPQKRRRAGGAQAGQ